jgi:hypothetical protein
MVAELVGMTSLYRKPPAQFSWHATPGLQHRKITIGDLQYSETLEANVIN